MEEYTKQQINFHSLQVKWWLTSALTGHAKQRKLFHGIEDLEFSDEEKIDDAMRIASRHMMIISDLMDSVAK